MEKYIFNEVMKLPCENNIGMLISLAILNKYVKVNLIKDIENQIYYEINITELLMSNITIEELMQVRNAKWEVNKNNNKLIRKLE